MAYIQNQCKECLSLEHQKIPNSKEGIVFVLGVRVGREEGWGWKAGVRMRTAALCMRIFNSWQTARSQPLRNGASEGGVSKKTFGGLRQVLQIPPNWEQVLVHSSSCLIRKQFHEKEQGKSTCNLFENKMHSSLNYIHAVGEGSLIFGQFAA